MNGFSYYYTYRFSIISQRKLSLRRNVLYLSDIYPLSFNAFFSLCHTYPYAVLIYSFFSSELLPSQVPTIVVPKAFSYTITQPVFRSTHPHTCFGISWRYNLYLYPPTYPDKNVFVLIKRKCTERKGYSHITLLTVSLALYCRIPSSIFPSTPPPTLRALSLESCHYHQCSNWLCSFLQSGSRIQQKNTTKE